MPTVVQFRRGTTAQNDAFTGAVGEITVDTEKDTLRIHDGSTAGGFELLQSNLTNQTISGHFVPSADVTYDLGDSATKWRDLYLSGSTIKLGGATLSASGTALALPAGSTIGGGSVLDSSSALALISGGTGISYNSSTGAISTDDSAIVHDNLSGFVADEHVAHSGVSITAGSGLTGGGDITTTRTLNVGEGTGITVGADAISTNDSEIVHDNLSGFVSDEHVAHTGVTLTAGTGLNGGGDISASRTFNIDSAELYANFDHDSFRDYVADEHVAHSGVSISAGAGLTGGGDITTTRTLNVGEGTGITVGADAISTNDSEIVHDNLSGFVSDEHVAHSNVTLTAGVGLNGGGTIASSRTFNIDSAELYANFAHDDFHDYVADEHVAHSTVSITAGNGLTGGGTIAASRTLNVGAGTGISVSADAISTDDSAIVHDNLSGFVADEHVAHSGVTLTAGAGLTGGGTIEASRSFAVGAGTGVTVNADDVAIGQDVATTADVTFATVTTTGNVTVGGDLTVNGTTTTVNTETINLADNIILINSNEAGTPSQNGGIEIERGTSANKTFIWDEVADKWTIGSETFVAGTFEGNLTGDVTGNADTATSLATARTIGGVSFDGTANINLPGVNTTGNQDTSGNAATATALETARTIGGVSFDGSANINLPGVNTTGNQDTSGNAATATALATARTIGLSGDVTATGVSFDGSGNITLTTAMAANSVDLTTHTTGNYVATLATGAGLDGSSSTEGGTPTISLDLSELTDMTAGVDGAADELILLDAGAERRKLISEINLGQFNNDQGWTSNVGDITGVTAGTALSGGGTSGSVTLNVSGVTSSEFSSAQTLVIYNSAGTALKTIYSPGS